MGVDAVKAERRIFSYTMQIEAEPETVFPLLCPTMEAEWIESWKCDMLYSESGYAELDGIFRTFNRETGLEDTWVISRHERPGRIEFVRWNEIRAIRYSIALKPAGPGRTESEWTQVVTALNERGNRYLRGLEVASFEKMCQTEEKMLNHYLKSGQKLIGG
jgi:hypothetical protein